MKSEETADMEKLDIHNRVAGIKQTRAAILSGNIKGVYVAADAQPSAVAQILELCRERGISPMTEYSARNIGRACGIDVPCAAAAATAVEN